VATSIQERVWHPSQRFCQRRDGSLEMRLDTTGRKEVVRWILSWMPDVQVLGTEELRQCIRAKLRKGSKNCSGS
jgi:predicted DNA-binding transcriptional regulator YafY